MPKPIASDLWTSRGPQHLVGPFDCAFFINGVPLVTVTRYRIDIDATGDQLRASGEFEIVQIKGRPEIDIAALVATPVAIQARQGAVDFGVDDARLTAGDPVRLDDARVAMVSAFADHGRGEYSMVIRFASDRARVAMRSGGLQ